MAHFDKHFTLEEANTLLPRIREVFAKIHQLINEARSERPKVVPLFKEPKPTNGSQKSNGHVEKNRSREEIMKEINELITEITDQGIVIQDVSRGLIDFPAFVDGEEVFLCYEMNDGDHIIAWHHLDAGYAGRQPIPEDLI